MASKRFGATGRADVARILAPDVAFLLNDVFAALPRSAAPIYLLQYEAHLQLGALHRFDRKAYADLAAHESVDLQTANQFSARKALFSGAGFFVLRASGRGTLAVNAVGGILRHDLRAGEVRAVDNGHLVAWDAAMGYEVRMAAQQRGLFASMASSAYTRRLGAARHAIARRATLND